MSVDALIAEEKNLPTVLWWTDSQHYSSSIKKCGDVSCFFTSNRSYLNHPSTQVGIALRWPSSQFKV